MRKKTLLFVCLGIFCASAGGALTSVNAAAASKAEISSLSATNELFLPSSITLTPMRTDENMTYLEKGVLLTSKNVKDEVEWKDDVVGNFYLDYLPIKSNGQYTANSLSLTFEEVGSSESFTLVVDHATMSAHVEFNGIKAGKYYVSESLERGLTEFCNEDGLYTQYTADKIRVLFDPAAMCVYIGSAESALTLVWDMSKEINDGRNVNATLAPFERYRVSLGIPSYVGFGGSVLLYEVNGCALDNLVLGTSGTPSVFADYEKDAVVGEKYRIPQGYAYDVLDGMIDVTTTAYDAEGTLIGEDITEFTPATAGQYTIVYSARNSYGVTTEKEILLTAYEAVPAYDYEIDWRLNDEYLLNEKVSVPALWLWGGLRRYGKEVGNVTVKKDGKVYDGYENVKSGFDFTFTESGTYTFVYNVNGEDLDYQILVDGAENRFVTAGLDSVYEKNSVLDCGAFYVLIEGEKTAFDFTVQFPNGKRYVNKKIYLNEAGRYALNAQTTVNGKKFEFEKYFVVTESYSDYFVGEHGMTIENGRSSFTGRDGVAFISTISGAKMQYTKPIDITKYVNQTQIDENGWTVLSDTATPIIEFSVDPEIRGTAAARQAYVYITDANDPDNVLTIYIDSRNNALWSSLRASAPSQPLTGFMNLKSSEEDVIKLNGAWGKLATSGTGFRTYHSFLGSISEDRTAEASKIAIYYDNEKKQLLCRPRDGKDSTLSYIVMDFDDPSYITSGYVWNGFTSDQVYISVSLNDIRSTSAKAVIYSVDGKSFETSKQTDEAPQISIESEDSIVGLKGMSLAVPKASAVDCRGNDVNNLVTKVYYERNGNLFDVSIQNGRFKTARNGTYHIVYTATDIFGRRAEKRIFVEVLERAEAFTATLDQVSDEYRSGEIAEKIGIYGSENISLGGAIGSVDATCRVFIGEEEIICEDGIFVPQKAGTYLVEYTFTDSVGRETKVSYEVAITAPQEPVIVGSIPTYVGFVRGNAYEIADIYFIDYAKADATKQKAEVYVNGELFTGTEYTAANKVEGIGETEDEEIVRLEYKYGEAVLLKFDIPVKTVYKKEERNVATTTIEVRKYLNERYFITDETTSVVANTNYLVLQTQRSDAEIWFAQPLEANGLNFVFDVDFQKAIDLSEIENNLKTLKIRIVDAKDASKSILVEIYEDTNKGNLRMRIGNSTSALSFTGSLLGMKTEQISIKYNAEENVFYDTSNKSKMIMSPIQYENGERFEGFGDTVYISIAMETKSAEENASIRMYSLNGQQFGNTADEDTREPNLIVNGEYGAIYEAGSKIEIYSANAYDVFSSIAANEFTLSVLRTENGRSVAVKDVNGLSLDKVSPKQSYVLDLTQTGEYRIVYTAKDCRGNETSNVYTINVIRHVDPVIEVKGELPKDVKAGEEVTLPSAEVTFMQENPNNLSWIVVISPSTNEYDFMKGNSFKATKLGVYKIRYCALDAYGSYTIVEYSVNCHE